MGKEVKFLLRLTVIFTPTYGNITKKENKIIKILKNKTHNFI